MAEERAQRRLAAILAADVVGYGRLLEQDEAGTLAALRERRRDILNPLVAEHNGRIVKVMGDGVLVEFGSAVNAVACAVELQKRMVAANDDLADDRHIVLRIGINVGDVVVEGGDLYGDGVIISVRLQGMAHPGGIYVSRTVCEHIGNKLPLVFDDLGPCEVKNISKPVQVFRARQEAQESQRPAEHQPQQTKPSIAVLPFTNMSGDPEQEYFSDGITEDIITELSRFTSLSVIARNSSFQFRGKSPDIVQIGRRLGVHYIVEGSVRRLGAQVRITAQLIDAATNRHLWAERYDRKNDDLFEMQDEVVRAVVSTLASRVDESEVEGRQHKATQNWVAYDYLLQARRGLSRDETWLRAEAPLRRAIELDPTLSEAHALLAYVLGEKYVLNGDRSHLDEALNFAERAIALNSIGSGPQNAMAFVCFLSGRYDLAGLHYERAIALNPNNIYPRISRARWLLLGGKCEEALAALEQSARPDQFAPDLYWEIRGMILFQLQRYRDVTETLGRWVKPYFTIWAYTIAAYAHSAQLPEAKGQIAALAQSYPDMTISKIRRASPYQHEALLNHLLDGLRKAGLPE
jgi:adenylate cyclase